MLPWSVSAMAGIPAARAAPRTSSRRLAPSRRLYWLWRWRWTNDGICWRDLSEWYQMSCGRFCLANTELFLRPTAHLEGRSAGDHAAGKAVGRARQQPTTGRELADIFELRRLRSPAPLPYRPVVADVCLGAAPDWRAPRSVWPTDAGENWWRSVSISMSPRVDSPATISSRCGSSRMSLAILASAGRRHFGGRARKEATPAGLGSERGAQQAVESPPGSSCRRQRNLARARLSTRQASLGYSALSVCSARRPRLGPPASSSNSAYLSTRSRSWE